MPSWWWVCLLGSLICLTGRCISFCSGGALFAFGSLGSLRSLFRLRLDSDAGRRLHRLELFLGHRRRHHRNHRVGVVEDLERPAACQVGNSQTVSDGQRRHISVYALGHLGRLAPNVNAVEWMFECSPFFDPGSLANKMDRDLNLYLFVPVDLDEIRVQQGAADRIPMEILHEGQGGVSVDLYIEEHIHARLGLKSGDELSPIQCDRKGLHPVAVDDAGDASGRTDTAGWAFTPLVPPARADPDFCHAPEVSSRHVHGEAGTRESIGR